MLFVYVHITCSKRTQLAGTAQSLSDDPPSYRAVAERMNVPEAHVTQHCLPKFAYLVRKAKLSLLFNSSAHCGRGKQQIDTCDFMSA